MEPDNTIANRQINSSFPAYLPAMFLFFLLSPVIAGENNKVLHEWYNHYYLHRDNQRLIKALDYFYTKDYSATELKTYSHLGFFSMVFRPHPAQAVNWLNSTHLSAIERRPLLLALATAGLTRQAVNLAVKDKWLNEDLTLLKHPTISFDLSDTIISKDVELGFLWGAFKASGDTFYIAKIIDILLQQINSASNEHTESILDMAVKTLQYHRKNHRAVDDYYQARYASLNSSSRAELDILLAADTGEESDPDCD